MRHMYRPRRGSSMTKVFHLLVAFRPILSTSETLVSCQQNAVHHLIEHVLRAQDSVAEIGRGRRIDVAVFVEANRARPKRQGLRMSLSPLLR
ncbi:uncharacterized protein F5891DRAFT_1008360 [Suillus fuscotomentosus]|uniref:Secreted protein n=1 Tax=Suillus fuscotomentosus TaxID=1912939 RepID=A0AAD4EFS6_9AGAM|nr:uncharacterized protein F5891DRAFT_1008360 [Suillus fuscotomentosus]KAG1905252.1 hypothetical protein F5891DRAFT_1008360 [Suillus fuscotomentosus]